MAVETRNSPNSQQPPKVMAQWNDSMQDQYFYNFDANIKKKSYYVKAADDLKSALGIS